MATPDSEEARRLRTRRRPASSDEFRTLDLWRAVVAECLASLLYVFLSCGAHVAWPLHSVTTLTVSFCGGFAMATVAHALGPVSGVHVNPALTLAVLVARRITPLRALLYGAAQCAGAVAGAALLLYGVAASSSSPHPGGSPLSLGVCTLVSPSLSPLRAAALEAALTFVVGLTLLASDDPRRERTAGDALALGIAHLACSLVALPATGASMNPARSLGPAFVTNVWTHHWVYWCGPSTGGMLAGLAHECLFDSRVKGIDSSDKEEVVEVRDDGKSSPGVAGPAQQSRQAQPRFVVAHEGPRPQSRGSTQYGQRPMQVASYYGTTPRGGAAYRTWTEREYCTPSQQFKF